LIWIDILPYIVFDCGYFDEFKPWFPVIAS
jgi:hypothetical protein